MKEERGTMNRKQLHYFIVPRSAYIVSASFPRVVDSAGAFGGSTFIARPAGATRLLPLNPAPPSLPAGTERAQPAFGRVAASLYNKLFAGGQSPK
jgi:hypothetical protein